MPTVVCAHRNELSRSLSFALKELNQDYEWWFFRRERGRKCIRGRWSFWLYNVWWDGKKRKTWKKFRMFDFSFIDIFNEHWCLGNCYRFYILTEKTWTCGHWIQSKGTLVWPLIEEKCNKQNAAVKPQIFTLRRLRRLNAVLTSSIPSEQGAGPVTAFTAAVPCWWGSFVFHTFPVGNFFNKNKSYLLNFTYREYFNCIS